MLITFEGIEGSGKGTVINLTARWLAKTGRDVLLTREPGGSPFGETIRTMLLSVESCDLSPTAELFLYLADRSQHMSQIVLPAINAGKVVISDRFVDSTIVYQGYGRGLPVHMLYTLNHIAVNGAWPDLTVLLDLPVKIGLKRAKARNKEQGIEESEGRFEAETLEFHDRIRNGYLDWASKYPDRIKVVDATGTPQEVFERVKSLIQAIFAEKN